MLLRVDNMECLLNKPRTWGVITTSREKALRVFAEVEEEFAGLLDRCILYHNTMRLEFSNGVYLIWVRPDEDVCGCRFSKAWVDSNIDETDWLRVAPMLVLSKDNITYI